MWGLLILAPLQAALGQVSLFENLTDEQGLGNLSVSALGQDGDGYILLGTEAGLYRYDGSAVTPYDDAVGLPAGDWIREIATERSGRVWVVTTGGVFVRTGSRFVRVDVSPVAGLRSPHLLALDGADALLDDGGTLLVARLREDTTPRFSALLDRATLDAHPQLRQARFVAADPAGGWLIGCGVAICRLDGGRATVLGKDEGLPEDSWQVAIRTPDGTLWARSLDRLAWRRPGRSTFEVTMVPGRRGPFYTQVPARVDLLADRRGGVLTQGEEGLLDWNGTAWRSIPHHEGGLPATPLESLFFDREGSLWAGSIGHGAFRSIGFGNWEHWTADDGLPSDIVWSMTRLANGEFWVATYSDTVALGGKAEAVAGGSENVVATRSGRLWIAPLRAPLVRLDRARGVTDTLSIPDNLSSMALDRADRLWLATDRALLVVPDADAPASGLHAELALPVPTTQVRTDPNGMVWAVTTRGLYRRNAAGSFEPVTSAPWAGGAEGIAFAPNGEIWIFTDSAGVKRFRLDHGQIRLLDAITAPQIGSDNILFLHRDRRGWMWVGTDHGIDLFDGLSWRHLDRSDGLVSNDMDQWAAYEDVDGSMWFGTSHGLSHLLHPTELPPSEPLHPLITSLSLGDRNLVPAPAIRIDWSASPLVIRFVDLDFARGHNVSFRYRLHGLDSTWSDTAAHEVRYADLPAGKFRFELVAIDAVHGSVSQPIVFTVRVRAPWWHRWWFYGLCVLASAATIGAAWQTRVRLLILHQRRLEQMVGVRTAEIEKATNELERLAMSDALTGLPNRRAIMKVLEEAVATALPTGAPLAVLLCDIDHFKKINDGFGHLAGDAVLAMFGHRLTAAITPLEAAGRYGGEEFCLVLPGSREEIVHRVDAIRSALVAAPYFVGGGNRIVTSSGGLAFLRPTDTTLSILARADAALYKAKESGRDRIEQERPDDGARPEPGRTAVDGDRRGADRRTARELGDLERDLRAALADDQFVLYYQPVLDTSRDRITSFEALLRWNSPRRGRVPPGDFIPQAEKLGLMPEIGDWVLRTACREAAGWPDDLKVSVNLSPAQFSRPDLVASIEDALSSARLRPERLELELTETAMIDNLDATTTVLRQVRALGVTVALDDFGTGYSSLSFLRTLPFDRIKIDRSFVQDFDVKPEAGVIVRAIIGMCRSLGAAVTAEGVETDDQISALRYAGCPEIQGYRISRPFPASELGKWLSPRAAARDSGPDVNAPQPREDGRASDRDGPWLDPVPTGSHAAGARELAGTPDPAAPKAVRERVL